MKKNGFTLIETLVILGLLSTLIVLSVTAVGGVFTSGKKDADEKRKLAYISIINNYLSDQVAKGNSFDPNVLYRFELLSNNGYIKDNECNSITMKKIDLTNSTFKVVQKINYTFKVDVNNIILKDTSVQCDSASLSGT